mmetsp:Transcript_30856/g.92026  ORF Transcript_30856/g.92026 Transcript_30856/m.92026 type:complete len:293 (+) Transcript_30856:365-1243(+)
MYCLCGLCRCTPSDGSSSARSQCHSDTWPSLSPAARRSVSSRGWNCRCTTADLVTLATSASASEQRAREEAAAGGLAAPRPLPAGLPFCRGASSLEPPSWPEVTRRSSAPSRSSGFGSAAAAARAAGGRRAERGTSSSSSSSSSAASSAAIAAAAASTSSARTSSSASSISSSLTRWKGIGVRGSSCLKRSSGRATLPTPGAMMSPESSSIRPSRCSSATPLNSGSTLRVRDDCRVGTVGVEEERFRDALATPRCDGRAEEDLSPISDLKLTRLSDARIASFARMLASRSSS